MCGACLVHDHQLCTPCHWQAAKPKSADTAQVIHTILDDCLLTDDEMLLGPEKWKEAWAEEDEINLSFDEDKEEPEVHTSCGILHASSDS